MPYCSFLDVINGANNVDTSAINVRAAEAVLHLEERISGTGYSFIVMI